MITGIRETPERNEFYDKKCSQVFIIDYTYKNISSANSMYISDMNFKIIDETGEVGDTYPLGFDLSYPQEIISGTTCKAQMVFGISNRSKKIKLQFWGSAWDNQPSAIFELNV